MSTTCISTSTHRSPYATTHTAVVAFSGAHVWGLLVVPPVGCGDRPRCVVRRAGEVMTFDDVVGAEHGLEAVWASAGIHAVGEGLAIDLELREEGEPAGDQPAATSASGTVVVGTTRLRVDGPVLRIAATDAAGLACESIVALGSIGSRIFEASKSARHGGEELPTVGGHRTGIATADVVKDVALRLGDGALTSLSLDFGGCPLGFGGTPPMDLDVSSIAAQLAVTSAFGTDASCAVTAWFAEWHDEDDSTDGRGTVLWTRPA